MKDSPLPGEKSPAEKIQEAFRNLKCLKPGYSLYDSTLVEILLMGGQLYWKDSGTPLNPEYHFPYQSWPFPGMPQPEHPNFRQDCNLKNSAKEIERIKKAAKELREAIVVMHQPAIHALVKAGFDSRAIGTIIANLITASDKGKETINEWKTQNPEWENVRKRRRTTEVELHIAMILAYEYHRATGKKPTISNHKTEISENGRRGNKSYGEFFNLVKTVFEALGINKKSTEGSARNAEDLWKKRREIQDQARAQMDLRKIMAKK